MKPAEMTALVNYGPGAGDTELRTVPVPELTDPYDVILRVEAVGICGSDVHQWLGRHSWNVNYPVILGHEFTGTIAELGAQVRAFAVGERVVSETAAVINHESAFAKQGLYHLDPERLGFGYGTDGAMAEFVRVPSRLLHRVSSDLPTDLAVLAEPCCVAYSAVVASGNVRPGQRVLVLGPGPIGLLCAALARISGATTVLVSGVSGDEARLAVARAMGIEAVMREEVPDLIAGLDDGYGVDVTIDAAGVSSALQDAIRHTRPGGVIVKVGWGPQPLEFSLDPLVQKAQVLRGSFSHNWSVWNSVLRLLESGQLDPAPLVSRVDSLKNWRNAFSDMHEGKAMKIVLTPTERGA